MLCMLYFSFITKNFSKPLMKSKGKYLQMNKKYNIDYTTTFSKDLKRVKKPVYNIKLVSAVVDKLQSSETLEAKYKDHALTGNWIGYRECQLCLIGY